MSARAKRDIVEAYWFSLRFGDGKEETHKHCLLGYSTRMVELR